MNMTHCDHFGSSRAMSDSSGSKVQWEDYYPFGSRLAGEGEGVSHQFTGQEKDEETGLMYYGTRYYDTESGRFISEDPAEPDWLDTESINRYVYCRNNPLKYIDPNGTNITGGDKEVLNGFDSCDDNIKSSSRCKRKI